jgi:pyruvate,water dikinase
VTLILRGKSVLEAGTAKAGGKGLALAQMQEAGFRVPPFLVIPPDAFANGKLGAEATSELGQCLQELGDSLAVRSSARSEDGAGDSHAGQFLTELDVKAKDVASAAARVLKSGLKRSVAAYRARRGHADVELPAVVVQEMVKAAAAGVAFAADPVSGRRDRIVVSAVKGLGDSLVSGLEDGETWMLSSPRFEVIARPMGDTVLTDDQAREVAKLCGTVSATRGKPQDIEWAYGDDGTTLYLLQARPITTPMLPEAPAEEKLFVLDNSNIVESYPGLVSPLTFSFAVQAYARVYRTFLHMVGVSQKAIEAHRAELGNMLSRVDGRMYYNLGNWYRLLSLLPFFSRNRQHMETMMGVASPLPDEAMAGAAPTPGNFAILRMVWRLLWQAIRLPATYRAFMARVADAVLPRADAPRLSGLPLSALAAEYRRIEAALLDRWDAPIVNDFLCMMSFGASRKLLQRWAGDRGLALHNDVMIGQGDIISAEPARLIREAGDIARDQSDILAALQRENAAEVFALANIGPKLSSYVERFGDRRIGELKLEQPTLNDDPTPLLRAVHASARAGRAVPDKKDPREQLRALFSGHPLRRRLASWALAYAKARVRDRENLRFERTRIFGHARRVFLAMGHAIKARGLLAEPGHIFQLTVAEVLGIAEGSAVTGDLKNLVALRLKEQEAFARLPDPPERILMRGAIAEKQQIETGVRRRAAETSERERTGTACGGGTVTGVARVIRDPALEQVKPGEILVARHTDPGWISHFANAAAVVAERGSVLSHSAIVSRELGIPCVVALADACAWIKSGEPLEVDGSSGRVRKIDG